MKFDEVVERIRCHECAGSGELKSHERCLPCGGSGIDPSAIDEASGWGTWAISVHDRPGYIVVVPLGLENPTGHVIVESWT